MWSTSLGKRTLTGKERDLFVAAAGMGIDMLTELASEGCAPAPFDASRWDNLFWHQQVCAIGEVSKHLLQDDANELTPSEWSEMTISSIYDFILFTNPFDFKNEIIDAANEVGINAKIHSNPNVKLDKILRQMRDRIIGKKKTKKEKIKEFGDSYYTEPFPSFSMDKFIEAHKVLDKASDLAVSALPKTIQNRNLNGFETLVKNEKIKPWYPIYSKKTILFCWKD